MALRGHVAEMLRTLLEAIISFIIGADAQVCRLCSAAHQPRMRTRSRAVWVGPSCTECVSRWVGQEG